MIPYRYPRPAPRQQLGGFWDDLVDVANQAYQDKLARERARAAVKAAEAAAAHEREMAKIEADRIANLNQPPTGGGFRLDTNTAMLGVAALLGLFLFARK